MKIAVQTTSQSKGKFSESNTLTVNNFTPPPHYLIISTLPEFLIFDATRRILVLYPHINTTYSGISTTPVQSRTPCIQSRTLHIQIHNSHRHYTTFVFNQASRAFRHASYAIKYAPLALKYTIPIFKHTSNTSNINRTDKKSDTRFKFGCKRIFQL
ncbi:MAG: hypothetical protein LBG17_07280 [Bacteroidales bacterium]|jgi:hypothetical protein|nr:hypothetical protein [Bacteroidales bacterium]